MYKTHIYVHCGKTIKNIYQIKGKKNTLEFWNKKDFHLHPVHWIVKPAIPGWILQWLWVIYNTSTTLPKTFTLYKCISLKYCLRRFYLFIRSIYHTNLVQKCTMVSIQYLFTTNWYDAYILHHIKLKFK